MMATAKEEELIHAINAAIIVAGVAVDSVIGILLATAAGLAVKNDYKECQVFSDCAHEYFHGAEDALRKEEQQQQPVKGPNAN